MREGRKKGLGMMKGKGYGEKDRHRVRREGRKGRVSKVSRKNKTGGVIIPDDNIT